MSFAVALTLTFGTADAWAKGNAAPPPVTASPPTSARTPSELPMAPLPGMADIEMLEYAQREAQAQQLENFEGGAFIIIGASGLALILFIVLLIILL